MVAIPSGPTSSDPAALRTAVLRLLDVLTPVLAFVGVILVWEAGVRVFAVPTFLLPPPSLIFTALVGLDPMLWAGHIWATVRVAMMGYLLSIAVSIPLAVILASSRLMSRTLYPFLIVIQSMPVVAVAPIIIVTLGVGDPSRVLITFLITFFPIVVSTTTGLLSTPPELIELSRSLRAGRAREIWHIRLPYATPHIFSALRISTTLALIGAVVAEFVSAERGLGYFITFSTSYFRIPAAFSGLVVLVILSLLMFRAIDVVQRVFARWSLPKG